MSEVPPKSRKPNPEAMPALLTNPPGHLWHEKWTVLSGPLSQAIPALLAPLPHFLRTPYTVQGYLAQKKPLPPLR